MFQLLLQDYGTETRGSHVISKQPVSQLQLRQSLFTKSSKISHTDTLYERTLSSSSN